MKKIVLGVEGMKCGMCESHVNDVVRKIDGVKKVKSSHSANKTEVVCEDGVSVEDINSALASQGYTVFSEDISDY